VIKQCCHECNLNISLYFWLSYDINVGFFKMILVIKIVQKKVFMLLMEQLEEVVIDGC
jgi:hypothetical protein